MKNILFQMAVTTMLMVGGLFNQASQAIEPDNIPNERKPHLSIEVDSKLIHFYEDESILSFNEEIVKRIEESDSCGGEGSTIKPVYVRVPFYFNNATAIYEKDYAKSGFLTNYNLHTYNLSTSHLNAHGFLSIPKGEGPFPCVILCHGSDGDTFMPEYMDSLAAEGVATLSLNRFGHHVYQDKDGEYQFIRKTGPDQLILPLETEIIETLSAAKLMASHPKIDPTKIGLAGWSRGGGVALECSMKRNIDSIYPGFKPAFCINYYTMPLIQRKDISLSPLLFLHGSDDDYTPVSCLINYVNFLSNQNYILPQTFDKETVFESDSIRVVVYPNSGHAFDGKLATWDTLFNSISTPESFIEIFSEIIQVKWNEAWGEESFQVSFPDYMNMSDCCVQALEDDTGFIDANNEKHPWMEFPQYLQSKIRFGVTLKISPKAGKSAWQETLAFIKKHSAKDSI